MNIHKLSFQKKICLSCFALYACFFLICALVFYHYVSRSLQQNMEDSLTSSTSMLMKDLDEILRNADSTLKDLLSDQELIQTSKEITDLPENYFTTHIPVGSKFQRIFRRSILSRDFEGALAYISRYGDNLSVSPTESGVSSVEKNQLLTNPHLVKLMEKTEYVAYLPPHQDYWCSEKTVFSVARSMRDSYHRYGLLFFNLDISAVTHLLDDFENPDSYAISILDENQNLVYSTSSDLCTEAFNFLCRKQLDVAPSGTFSQDDFRISCYSTSTLTGWNFILSADTTEYMQSMRQLLLITAVLFFSLFLISSISLYLITLHLTKPLKQLCTQLENLEPGKNIPVSEISGDNEISVLTNAVQVFLTEIYRQNQRLTEAKKRTLQAHYNAMEAQLNPHFLYNTLSVIGMTGLTEGSRTVSQMCSELANLLRYSISYSGQSVRLIQEIENGKTYLYLMKMRYEEDLVCHWESDSNLEQLLVPKLILQPLLENCFQHGFRSPGQEVLPPWNIRIRTFHDECHWYLTISNTGAPFPCGQLDQLKQRIHQFDEFQASDPDIAQKLVFRQGFGLENTILRLHIFLRGREYFQVTSENGWTTVTLGGPLDFSGLSPFE